MAAISITTNLVTINTAEPGTLAQWVALGGGATGLAEETDFAVQGSTSISKQVKLETKGMAANNGSMINLGTTAHVYVWLYATTPGATNVRASGGLRVVMGSATNAYNEYYVNGRDGYKYGGWVCYPVQFSQTPDSTVGTTLATPQYFGGIMSNTVTVRGINFGVDVVRYGDSITAIGGGTPDPAITFARVAQENDLTNNAWGIMQGTPSGVSLQGKLLIGNNNTTTATTFSDTDAVIVKPNNNPADVNQKTATNFSGLVLRGTQTNASFTGCTFLSLDTVDRGFLDCDTSTNAVGSATFTSCTFLDWGRIGGRSTALFSGCSFKQCAQMIANGSPISGSAFTGCEPVDVGTNLGVLTDCTFNSGGSGYAITTSATSGTLSFVGNQFNGYGANGTTDAAIFFSGLNGTVTVNISGGGDIPTYTAFGVIVNFVSASTLTFTGVKDGSEIRIYEAGTTNELDGIESVTGGTFSSSISVGAVDAVVFALGYLEVRYYGLTTTSDLSVPVQQTVDRQYDAVAPVAPLTIISGAATGADMAGSINWYADSTAMTADGWTVEAGLTGLDQTETAIFMPAQFRNIEVLNTTSGGVANVPNTDANGQLAVSGNGWIYWLNGSLDNGVVWDYVGGFDMIWRRGGTKTVSRYGRQWFVVRGDIATWANQANGFPLEAWIATDGSMRWVVGAAQGTWQWPNPGTWVSGDWGIFRKNSTAVGDNTAFSELGTSAAWPNGFTANYQTGLWKLEALCG